MGAGRGGCSLVVELKLRAGGARKGRHAADAVRALLTGAVHPGRSGAVNGGPGDLWIFSFQITKLRLREVIEPVGGAGHLLPLDGKRGEDRHDSTIFVIVWQGGTLGHRAEPVLVDTGFKEIA